MIECSVEFLGDSGRDSQRLWFAAVPRVGDHVFPTEGEGFEVREVLWTGASGPKQRAPAVILRVR